MVKVWSCLAVMGQTHVAGHRRGAAVAQSGVVWAERKHQFKFGFALSRDKGELWPFIHSSE